MKLSGNILCSSIVSAILALWVFPASHALATTVREITQALTCPCGCNMVVNACEGSMECMAAGQITDEVIEMVAKGQSKDEIIQYFVKTNGERILAAPTKKGFDLTAWILPFLAIFLGGGGVYVFLAGCLPTRRVLVDKFISSGKEEIPNNKYWEQFETELKDYDL